MVAILITHRLKVKCTSYTIIFYFGTILSFQYKSSPWNVYFVCLAAFTDSLSWGQEIIHDFWLPLWYLVAIVLSVLLFTASDYHFGILWPLYCLSFYLRFLITTLVSYGHCIVCPSIYGFWLPLCYIANYFVFNIFFSFSIYILTL